MEIRAAILGLGNIAQKMADTINHTDGVTLYAVASRTAEKAEEFAETYGAVKAYGSYEEMLQDDRIDLVYVATPHAFHAENARMCLEHNKHVLVEKPFAVNAQQAIEVFALAKEKNLFAGEAMWSRYQPIQKQLSDIIKSGVIGDVAYVTAFTGGHLRHVPRLAEPALAGGALLDVGVYPLNFALSVIKEPVVRLDANAVLSDKGVDLQNAFTVSFKSGKMAVLGSSMVSEMDSKGVIYGTKGRIEAKNIINIEKLIIYTPDGSEIIQRPEQHTGFEYELLSAVKAIGEGKIEPDEMPHRATINMLRITDGVRRRCGIKYPFEEEL